MAEFIAENEVKEAVVQEQTSPGGNPIVLVSYKNGKKDEFMTKLKYDVIKTANRSDANGARKAVVDKVGVQLFAILMEYGVTVAEVDPIINETIRIVNHTQDEANDILWGVNNAYERTLLDVQRVLRTKHGTTPETTA